MKSMVHFSLVTVRNGTEVVFCVKFDTEDELCAVPQGAVFFCRNRKSSRVAVIDSATEEGRE